jgi:bacteriocin-like protein
MKMKLRQKQLNRKELSQVIGGRRDMILVAFPHTVGPDGMPGSGRGGGAQMRAIGSIPPWRPNWWK